MGGIRRSGLATTPHTVHRSMTYKAQNCNLSQLKYRILLRKYYLDPAQLLRVVDMSTLVNQLHIYQMFKSIEWII